MHRRKDTRFAWEGTYSLWICLPGLVLCWRQQLSSSSFTTSKKAQRRSWRTFLRLWVCYSRLGIRSPWSCPFGSGRGESLLESGCKMHCSHPQHRQKWRNRWWSGLPKATQEISRRSKSGADIPVSLNNGSSPELSVWYSFTKHIQSLGKTPSVSSTATSVWDESSGICVWENMGRLCRLFFDSLKFEINHSIPKKSSIIQRRTSFHWRFLKWFSIHITLIANGRLMGSRLPLICLQPSRWPV